MSALVRVAYGRLYGDELNRADDDGTNERAGVTYRTDHDLSRGDIVLVGRQPHGYKYEQVEATVLGMGSAYTGRTRHVLRRIEWSA